MISAVNVSYLGVKNRHSQITAEAVARKFRCGLETAKQTLKSTTQYGVRQAIHPLRRMYRVDHIDINCRRIRDTFYMDTLFSKVKSINGHVCAQVITNGQFTRVYPMMSKASENIAMALREFIDDVGVPDELVCDLDRTGWNSYACDGYRSSLSHQNAFCGKGEIQAESSRGSRNSRIETTLEDSNDRAASAESAMGLWIGIHCRDFIDYCAW